MNFSLFLQFAVVFILMISSYSMADKNDEDKFDDDSLLDDQPTGNRMSFKAPQFSEEEMHSNFMPDYMKCDACRAIAYQITRIYQKLDKKFDYQPEGPPESEVMEVTEKIFNGLTYEDYGVKEIEGEMRLTGPPLEATDHPGMMQGGGKWPGRVLATAQHMFEEYDEMTIYLWYKEFDYSLESEMCYGANEPFNYCTQDFIEKHEKRGKVVTPDLPPRDEL